MIWLITWDWVGPLGGKWRLLVEKVGEWYVESRHLQGCNPCLCRLRTDGLAPASKYWMYRSYAGIYGSSKPNSLPSTDAWLCPHCFNGWLGRETVYRPADRSADVLWIMSGALFLGSSGPAQLCWWLRKRLLYVDHMRYVWSSVTCWLDFSTTGCISIRIDANLRYE
jgi:hypothetical protein